MDGPRQDFSLFPLSVPVLKIEVLPLVEHCCCGLLLPPACRNAAPDPPAPLAKAVKELVIVKLPKGVRDKQEPSNDKHSSMLCCCFTLSEQPVPVTTSTPMWSDGHSTHDDRFVAPGEITVAKGSVTAPVNGMKPLAGAHDRKLCPQDWCFGMKHDILKVYRKNQSSTWIVNRWEKHPHVLARLEKKEFFSFHLVPHFLCAGYIPLLEPLYCIWKEMGTWASCAILSATGTQDKMLTKTLIFSFTLLRDWHSHSLVKVVFFMSSAWHVPSLSPAAKWALAFILARKANQAVTLPHNSLVHLGLLHASEQAPMCFSGAGLLLPSMLQDIDTNWCNITALV